jgi:hypothetical protein
MVIWEEVPTKSGAIQSKTAGKEPFNNKVTKDGRWKIVVSRW